MNFCKFISTSQQKPPLLTLRKSWLTERTTCVGVETNRSCCPGTWIDSAAWSSLKQVMWIKDQIKMPESLYLILSVGRAIENAVIWRLTEAKSFEKNKWKNVALSNVAAGAYPALLSLPLFSFTKLPWLSNQETILNLKHTIMHKHFPESCQKRCLLTQS